MKREQCLLELDERAERIVSLLNAAELVGELPGLQECVRVEIARATSSSSAVFGSATLFAHLVLDAADELGGNFDALFAESFGHLLGFDAGVFSEVLPNGLALVNLSTCAFLHFAFLVFLGTSSVAGHPCDLCNISYIDIPICQYLLGGILRGGVYERLILRSRTFLVFQGHIEQF